MKSWSNVASRQLQSVKKSTTKIWRHCLQSKIFPPCLRQAAKIYVATSHNVVQQETFEISEQRTTIYTFLWFFAQEVDWCLKDCDKQSLQTTVSINLWKISTGHTGDWFDVKTASICTTELWDALKNFILSSLKIKVAPYTIIVSLDTLRQDPPLEAILVIFGRRALIFFCLKALGKKWKMTPLLCACAVVITLETQKCRKRAPHSVEFNFFNNCDRQKRFSQNERRRADLQNVASDFLIFA